MDTKQCAQPTIIQVNQLSSIDKIRSKVIQSKLTRAAVCLDIQACELNIDLLSTILPMCNIVTGNSDDFIVFCQSDNLENALSKVRQTTDAALIVLQANSNHLVIAEEVSNALSDTRLHHFSQTIMRRLKADELLPIVTSLVQS